MIDIEFLQYRLVAELCKDFCKDSKKSFHIRLSIYTSILLKISLSTCRPLIVYRNKISRFVLSRNPMEAQELNLTRKTVYLNTSVHLSC